MSSSLFDVPTSPIDHSPAVRSHWDLDASDYHARHRSYLAGFHWCPEMLSEQQAGLLGDVTGQRILEIGCGSAPCSRWLADRFPTATVVGVDLSTAMLGEAGTDHTALLAGANALCLPFAAQSFDQVFSAFGAIPFIKDIRALYGEVARVLAPGGVFTFATNHPMRWVFADDPTEAGLVAQIPYFARDYVETAEDGTATYAEFQHTIADHINALSQSGFTITGCHEPTWPQDLTEPWGQWSPLRGAIFPGTIIFQAQFCG